jgi:hypothetical protein
MEIPKMDKAPGAVAVGIEQTTAFNMLAQRSALKLEIKGLKMSKGSVYAHIKKTYNLKGGKQKVLDQFEELLMEQGILARPTFAFLVEVEVTVRGDDDEVGHTRELCEVAAPTAELAQSTAIDYWDECRVIKVYKQVL